MLLLEQWNLIASTLWYTVLKHFNRVRLHCSVCSLHSSVGASTALWGDAGLRAGGREGVFVEMLLIVLEWRGRWTVA